jgi:hypothetical protein
LKAQEIANLDLRGAYLMVLSACNTGHEELRFEVPIPHLYASDHQIFHTIGRALFLYTFMKDFASKFGTTIRLTYFLATLAACHLTI